MKCCICMTEIPQGVIECSCCGFVDERRMHILGDATKIAEQVEAKAMVFRKKFLQGIDIGIITYSWKDVNNTLMLDKENRISFGKGDVLMEQTQWLERKFARVPGADKITATLSVQRAGQTEKLLHVEVEALTEAELQQVGVSLSSDMTLKLLVKNNSASVQSEPIAFL